MLTLAVTLPLGLLPQVVYAPVVLPAQGGVRRRVKAAVLVRRGARAAPRISSEPRVGLFQHEDIPLRAHIFQDLRPDGDADFAQMRFAQDLHERARLANAAANA